MQYSWMPVSRATAIGPGIFKLRPSYWLCMHTQRNVLFSTRWQSAVSLWGRQAATGGLFMHDSWPLCTWPGPNRLVQEAVKMITSPSHWLTQHTFIALYPSSNLECISWGVGPTCLANTCRYQHTHTHTQSLSLFLCVCRGICVRTSVSETEFGRYKQLQVWSLFCFGSDFFFQFMKVTFTLCGSCCNSLIFLQFDFCAYYCWSVIRINTSYTSEIIIW